MECRCDDEELFELRGAEVSEYREHLGRVTQEGQGWYLFTCPVTGQEWIQDSPFETSTRDVIGTFRLRRFPLRDQQE